MAVWYNHFIIAPPLIITKDEIDKGVEVIDEVLKVAAGETSLMTDLKPKH